MTNILLVPIHVDALCLAKQQEAVRAMADYRLLPYKFQNDTYATGDLNLAKQILAPLFNHEFTLKAGIHLHWSLPDALTNGEHENAGTTFPQVPNRWLILRKGGYQGEKQWIVESDYLYPTLRSGDNSPPPDAVNILIEPPNLADVNPEDPSTYQYQRFRYMGRTWELSQWNQWEQKEYADALTALGPHQTVSILDSVKGTFAAFYPNCHSVFGFRDPDYCTDTPPSGLQYDVVGWYANAQQDCLQQFLREHSGKSNAELLEILQEELGWTLEGMQGFPQRTVYHSRITFSGSGGSAARRIANLSKPTIAVANSAPEALSAYLANTFSANDANIRKAVEEKLEALHISERLDGRKLDIGAKFREGRHERGFGTENDGFLWAILPDVAANESNNTREDQVTQESLPTNLAHQLNQLNVLQEEYNQAWLNIESLRRQLYGQFYYYMNNQSEGDGEFYDTIYDTTLPLTRTAIAQAGELEFTDQGGNVTVRAKTLSFGIASKLDDKWSDDYDKYLSYYVGIMNAAARGTFDRSDDADYCWADIESEFTACGVTLSSNPNPDVTTITNNQAWRVRDGGVNYEVKLEAGILGIYIPPTSSQTADRLVNAINSLLGAIATHNNSSSNKYRLSQFPSQNYWVANDPVLLLEGESTKAPDRFGQDGRLRNDGYLECTPCNLDVANITTNIGNLENLLNGLNQGNINFITWNKQPWNPFAFHWSILDYPSRQTSNGNVRDYSANQILDNYSLEPNAIDLQLKSGRENSFVPTANTYSGFSILTPSASLGLTKRLTQYLTKQLKITPDDLRQNIGSIKNNYENEHSLYSQQAQANDPIFVALWAYEQMQTRHCQAQAIGGFNDTLLVAQPTFWLEVDNPLTTNSDEQVSLEEIRWTLGDSLQYQINYGDIFNPIRSGAMAINGLWLIDSFGQHQAVIDLGNEGSTQVVTTAQMIPPPSNNPYQVLLPPRLAQPARLNFHWLAADEWHEVEMTAAPTRTPVCGWLVPNNLDSTLGIHDDRGKALGIIDTAGNWRNAPGANISRSWNGHPDLSGINVHLNKMVNYLLDQGADFQQQFISTLDNSLETIDPESFAEHPSLALLVGRPVALVRATFSLEVKGLPARDPQVKIEDTDQAPATHGFEGVKFPIRLGDYGQLNDGLVGYWREDPTGNSGDYNYAGNVFYAPQCNLRDDTDKIQTEAEGLVYFEQTVDAPPQAVTMLVDPRGLIHATCGILPNRELRLPSENYSQALRAIEVNFLSTPIVCNEGAIAMPLPKEPEYVWHWLSLNGENWSETATIESVNTKASFSKPQQIYEGWLQLSRVEDRDS